MVSDKFVLCLQVGFPFECICWDKAEAARISDRIIADMCMKHKCLDWKTMTVSERNAVSRFYRNKEHFRIEKDQPTPKLFYQNKEVLKQSVLRRMIVKFYHDLKGVGYRTLLLSTTAVIRRRVEKVCQINIR